MPARTIKSRYRRVVTDRATRVLSRIFRLPSRSTVTFLLSLGASVWIIIGYAGLKIKENALRSANERRRNDRVKTHFQATLSNISFTVYALLPTLSAQIISHLNVETLTEELKGVAAAGATKVPHGTDSGMASWTASSESDGNTKSLESSTMLSSNEGERDADKSLSSKADDGVQGLGIQTGSRHTPEKSSWVQEFNSTIPHAPIESDMSDMGATSAGEDGTASSRSQSISLPPTSPSRSVAGLANQELETSPFVPAQHSSLNPPEQGEHSVSSPAPPSSISISGSNPSFTDQSSDAGSSPPYLHSPPGSPSVSPFRRPLHIEPPSGGQPLALPSTMAKPPISQEQFEGIQTQGSADRPKAQPPAVELKKTKAQLWNGIKVTSITRTVTTMYLLPLLVLQTTSQLTLLSRLHLLRTLAAEHHGLSTFAENEDDEDDDVSTIASTISPSSSALGRLMKAKEAILRPWSYFSVGEMGLQDIADETTNPRNESLGVLGSIWAGITSNVVSQAVSPDAAEKTPVAEPLHSRLDAETERLFLCMSWWFLHVGWRILEEVATMAVENTCQALPLKKEMTLDDWNDLLTDIRRKIDESLSSSKLLHMLLPPPTQAEFDALLDRYPTDSACPFAGPPYSPMLTELLDETASHLTSIDFIYVFSHSILLLQGALLSRIASELYNQDLHKANDSRAPHHASVVELQSKKLVQCLPTLTRWSKGVWQAMPDEAIDQLTGSHNVQAFTALVYGDFGCVL